MRIDDFDKELVEGVQRFVSREIEGRAEALEDSDAYPDAIIAGMAEMGLFSIAIPPEYGGLGLSVSTYARIMEELAAGWASLPSFINSHCSASSILARHGTPEQKARYLPRMASGELRGAIALTEPSAGSDLQAIRATARRTGEGGYRLKGGKVFITNGERASVCVVLAKTPSLEPGGKDGISLFILEKGMSGFTVGAHARKLGFRQVDTTELLFDDVELDAGQLVGGVEGKGLAQMLDALETGRIAIAASAVGLSRSALNAATRYAREREAFGGPIAGHQAVQSILADMAAKTVAARTLTLEAARMKDAGGRCDMIAGMAKLVAGETCGEVTLNCVRIHGGYGYVAGFPAERYYREAPFYIVTEGTNEIQKQIIARRLLNGDGHPWGLA